MGIIGIYWYTVICLASFLNLIHFQDSISYEGGCSDRMATLEGWKSGTCTGGRLECKEIHYHLQTNPRLFAIQNVPEQFPMDILDRSIFFFEPIGRRGDVVTRAWTFVDSLAIGLETRAILIGVSKLFETHGVVWICEVDESRFGTG